MARITDPERLERIKESTMALIVENGYLGVTISNIAQRAQVSTGHLYRHFDSKEALINFLINDSFSALRNSVSQLLEENSSVHDVITYQFRSLLQMANETPVKARFACSLASDPRYNVRNTLNIRTIAQHILDKGRQNHEIGEHITLEMALLFLIQTPIGFMAQKLNNSPESGITEDEILLLTQLCLKALS